MIHVPITNQPSEKPCAPERATGTPLHGKLMPLNVVIALLLILIGWSLAYVRQGNWGLPLIFSLVCLALFLGLVWLVARQLHGHIRSLEQARLEAESSRQNLYQLQRRQEMIFNAISEGIHWIDCAGKIIYENPAAARMLGWEVAELMGKPAHATMHHTHADGTPYPKHECHIYAGLHDGQMRQVSDEVFWRKDGTSFPVEYTSTPLRDDNGRILGCVVVFTDITRRRQAAAELEAANRRLLEASRQAGKAEIATSVLHNVGNVLNSLNVSVNVVTSKVHDSSVGNLSKAVGLMTQHTQDIGAYLSQDKQGRQIPAFLQTVAKVMSEEQGILLQEMATVAQSVEHIKQIIHVQQSDAKNMGVAEMINVVSLLEDALRINSYSLESNQVQIIREFSHVPTITSDRHAILQIFINLISNAKHALMGGTLTPKRLILRSDVRDEGHWLRIQIADNGMGIDPANLARIFNHGFTTKQNGHGFGLHSSARYAQQLGGSLTAYSDGPGQGATFTLELPVTKALVPA